MNTTAIANNIFSNDKSKTWKILHTYLHEMFYLYIILRKAMYTGPIFSVSS